MEIWTEIRGTLKGAMDGNWSKTRPQHQDGYKPLKDIEKYVSWSGEKRTFVLNDTVENIRNRAKNDEKLSDNGKQLLDKALHYFSSFSIKSISLLINAKFSFISFDPSTRI